MVCRPVSLKAGINSLGRRSSRNARTTTCLQIGVFACCLFLSSCAPFHVWVGGPLDGVVVDSHTQKPIQGAEVAISGFKGTAVLTDATGRFHQSARQVVQWRCLLVEYLGVPSCYPLSVRASGYKPQDYEPCAESNSSPARIVLEAQPAH